MLGMSAFNRKPRQFTYTPRYYDPQKEDREERQRAKGILEEENEKYVPGSFIRLQRVRRLMGTNDHKKSDKRSVVLIRFIVAIILLFFLAYFIINFNGLEQLIGAMR